MQTEEERIANLERRLKDLERLLMAMENMLSRIPDSILLGPKIPTLDGLQLYVRRKRCKKSGTSGLCLLGCDREFAVCKNLQSVAHWNKSAMPRGYIGHLCSSNTLTLEFADAFPHCWVALRAKAPPQV
jgi:hypothetical protein